MEGAPERKALRERAITLEMLEFLEATQPLGMPIVRPTKAAELQSGRDSEIGHPHLVVAETEDGHGAGETNPVLVGMTGW
jgi:hypothetical protein